KGERCSVQRGVTGWRCWRVLLPLLVPAPSSAQGRVPPSEVNQAFQVGDRSMYLVCSGRGSPTVVFEADAGRTSSDWQKVRDEVIEFTRACAYDRAGLGRSTPGKPEQDPIIITTQLEVL